MNILITGATGFIGEHLIPRLNGHQIFIVSRKAFNQRLEVIQGDLTKGPIEHPALSHIDAVINLAGENVSGGRWTSSQKKRIAISRIDLTKHLHQSLKKSQLKSWTSVSAVGYYGDRGEELLTEGSRPSYDFLSKICQEWEAANLWDKGPRTSIFRLGVVLGEGGALKKMRSIFKWGLGGKLGDGRQWLSWVHVEDVAQMLADSVTDPNYHGIYNAVAPTPVRNEEFTRALAASFGKKPGPSVPAFVLKLAMGEMSSMVLGSQRVSCEKLLKQGFQFKYAQIGRAL